MSKMSESAHRENMLSALSASNRESLDRVCKLSEDNGWNAAINACREALPPEWSIKLRHLYRKQIVGS